MKKCLELGSGRRPYFNPNYDIVHADMLEGEHIERIVDCEKPLPFEDEEFDLVVARRLITHVRNFYQLTNEVHRILKPNATFQCSTTHFSSPYAWKDPSHVRCGHSRMFFAWTEKNPDINQSMMSWAKGEFELIDFDFVIRFGKITKPIVKRCFHFYERWLATKLFYIDMITFTLRKK